MRTNPPRRLCAKTTGHGYCSSANRYMPLPVRVMGRGLSAPPLMFSMAHSLDCIEDVKVTPIVQLARGYNNRERDRLARRFVVRVAAPGPRSRCSRRSRGSRLALSERTCFSSVASGVLLVGDAVLVSMQMSQFWFELVPSTSYSRAISWIRTRSERSSHKTYPVFFRLRFVNPSDVRMSPTFRSFRLEGSPRDARSAFIAVVNPLSLQPAADGWT